MRFWWFLRDIAILVRMCWHFLYCIYSAKMILYNIYIYVYIYILYIYIDMYNLLINYVYTTICNFCFWLWVQFQPFWWLGRSGSVLCISTFPIEWEAKELQIELLIHDSLSDIASTNWQWAMLGGKERKPLLDWDDTFGHEKARVKAMSMFFSCFFTVANSFQTVFSGFIITIDSIDLR